MARVRVRTKASDPAPSRWAYRLERLWLRPAVRALALRGLPALAVVLALGLWAADGDRRAAAARAWTDAVDAVKDRPEFLVRHLRVEGASDGLRSEIGGALRIDLPVSRFRLDLAALRASVEALEPVRSAEVRLREGGLLELRVIERDPAVAFLRDDGIDVLDADGHRVAAFELVEEVGTLPLISGEHAERRVPEALALVEAAAPVGDRLVGLVRVGERRWDVVLDGDQRILLPEASPVEALDRALALDAAKNVLDRDVAVLDLRLRGRPTVRLRPAARDALLAMRVRARDATDVRVEVE